MTIPGTSDFLSVYHYRCKIELHGKKKNVKASTEHQEDTPGIVLSSHKIIALKQKHLYSDF